MTMIYQMHYIVNSGSSLRLTSDKPRKDKGTVLGLVKNCGSEVFIYGWDEIKQHDENLFNILYEIDYEYSTMPEDKYARIDIPERVLLADIGSRKDRAQVCGISHKYDDDGLNYHQSGTISICHPNNKDNSGYLFDINEYLHLLKCLNTPRNGDKFDHLIRNIKILINRRYTGSLLFQSKKKIFVQSQGNNYLLSKTEPRPDILEYVLVRPNNDSEPIIIMDIEHTLCGYNHNIRNAIHYLYAQRKYDTCMIGDIMNILKSQYVKGYIKLQNLGLGNSNVRQDTCSQTPSDDTITVLLSISKLCAYMTVSDFMKLLENEYCDIKAKDWLKGLCNVI